MLSVTDTVGNNYVLAGGPTTQAEAGTQAIYYAANIGAAARRQHGDGDVQCGRCRTRMCALRSTAVFDRSSRGRVRWRGAGTGTTSNSGAVTTTNANALLVGANYVTTHTTGAGTGFTSRVITGPDGSILEDRIVSAAGTLQRDGAADRLVAGSCSWWRSARRRRWRGHAGADGAGWVGGDGGLGDPGRTSTLDGLDGQRGGDELPDRAVHGGGLHDLRAGGHLGDGRASTTPDSPPRPLTSTGCGRRMRQGT